MKDMHYIALKSGYSFKKTYCSIEKLLEYGKEAKCIGVADDGNTFSHYFLEKAVEGTDIKPIYGVRVKAVLDPTLRNKETRGQHGYEYTLIAKNPNGLKEIYNIVRLYNHHENSYYQHNAPLSEIFKLSKDVIVISEYTQNPKRLDYVGLSATTPPFMIDYAKENDIKLVATVNNYYPEVEDKKTYELLVGAKNADSQTYPQHILSTKEHLDINLSKGAIARTREISEQCEHFKLPKAPMVKYKGKKSLEKLCLIGAKRKGLDIINDGVYKDRYQRELKTIKEKDFVDYFLIVEDVVSWAKKTMLVGSGRGSAAGSLVCFLLGITEVIDPIEHNLLFERFIDASRPDLPDIDIDFPVSGRKKVINYIIKKFGEENVKTISSITTFQPNITINEFAKELSISAQATKDVKSSMIERNGGHPRANYCIKDTFETVEAGVKLIQGYPEMALAANVENHPRNAGKHAAGVIVCNEPIHKFCGVNMLKSKGAIQNTVMLEKKGAEYLQLLKIDILGLRTLSILEDCAKSLGMNILDYYDLPLDDEKTFELLRSGRLEGIFQFEGEALAALTKEMGVENFDDMMVITALARPAAKQSGGDKRFVEFRLGLKEPKYLGKEHEEATKETFGIVAYQEQIFNLCGNVGGFSDSDKNALRRGLSKSLGKEFFAEYKDKFLKGGLERGYSREDTEFLWSEIKNGGSYAFNKSHAASYSVPSYWCAYMKANHPREFTVANLNNPKSEGNSALKILRDAVENNGLEYLPVCPDYSQVKWSVHPNGTLIGGLQNIEGVGVAKAKEIIKKRNSSRDFTPKMFSKLLNPVTDFDTLYPCYTNFKGLYDRPNDYNLSKVYKIKDVVSEGTYIVIGQLRRKITTDLNSLEKITKRNGKVFENDTFELYIKVEDDTDIIGGIIKRDKFEKIGRQLSESGGVDKDWYLIKGTITNAEYRRLEITNLELITHQKGNFND